MLSESFTVSIQGCLPSRRWFPKDKVELQTAKFLDLILYSREQLVKEYDAMPDKGSSGDLPDAPWGIISIKPQVGKPSKRGSFVCLIQTPAGVCTVMCIHV